MADRDGFWLLVAVLGALALWGLYYRRLWALARLRVSKQAYLLLFCAPLFCLALVIYLLSRFAASDVRPSPGYLVFYVALGALVVGVATRLTLWLGVSARDDGLERGNAAAAWTMTGAMIALTLCYLGGNFGEGPGWHVVLFSAVLAIGGLFAAWGLVELLGGISEAITVDRDLGTGIHMAGFLTACGMILGRAVAGNWVSVPATFHDFISVGWPVLFWVGAEALMGAQGRWAKTQAPPALGILIALLHVTTSAYYVVTRGWW
ncbi:MAG TPA: hypothetical protein VJS92_08770 [Candidatus Polarisedimenticolaceae bacterium]|nr:hypothetical protein [Candidatus Polarisedimenticolaceae bacterium]